jgi:hypothetical protein
MQKQAFAKLGGVITVSWAALSLAGAGAYGQEAVPLAPLLECRAQTDEAQRLACYDEAVERLAGSRGELVAVDLADVEAVERDGFGFSMPSLPSLSLSLFSRRELGLETDVASGAVSGDAIDTERSTSGIAEAASRNEDAAAASSARVLARTDDGQIDQIEMTVVDVRLLGYDTVLVEMNNGQVWEVVGGRDLRRLPRRVSDGSAAIIRRAAAGSFLLQFDGTGPAYRVRRRE